MQNIQTTKCKRKTKQKKARDQFLMRYRMGWKGRKTEEGTKGHKCNYLRLFYIVYFIYFLLYLDLS